MIAILTVCLLLAHTCGVQINRTGPQRHSRREENNHLKERPPPATRQQHYKSYPIADSAEEYINSYEADYGEVSNFTESDGNPPLYPNPDILVRRDSMSRRSGNFVPEPLTDELPDDSLADADLKDHNLIDSVTYLYGYSTTSALRTEWILLVYVSRALACILVIGTAVWVLWSDSAENFRSGSELYPVNVNLLCSLAVCNLIYMEAIMGVSSDSRCEMVALLLHYAHLVCAAWLLALCWSVTGHCVKGSAPPLKYNYLFAYGVPAVMVLFNYALSVEQYETKHYCWMSLEKGMLLGFMLPGTVLIVVTTAMVLLGLRSVHRKENEMRAGKIQELIEQHINNLQNASAEGLAPASRNNTDTDEALESAYSHDFNYDQRSPVECRPERSESNQMTTEDFVNLQSMKFDLMNMSIDNLSWKSDSSCETDELKSYLNFCLVMQPLYAVVWLMGVVALENSSHWLTPAVFLVLCTGMYTYVAAQMCTHLPVVKRASDAASCCEELISETGAPRTRTTDSIPLLDSTATQQPVTPAAPGDTISTISI